MKKGYIYALLSSILFGSAGIYVNFAYKLGMNSINLLMLQYIFSGLKSLIQPYHYIALRRLQHWYAQIHQPGLPEKVQLYLCPSLSVVHTYNNAFLGYQRAVHYNNPAVLDKHIRKAYCLIIAYKLVYNFHFVPWNFKRFMAAPKEPYKPRNAFKTIITVNIQIAIY